MTSSVIVLPGRSPDLDLLNRALGAVPLPVEAVAAPSIMVDGRFHTAACRWLKRRHDSKPVSETSVAHARRLVTYIQFLRDERHRIHPDEFRSDVFATTAEDLKAFYRQRQYDPEKLVASSTWKDQRVTIKLFHQFLLNTYGVPLPFTLRRVFLKSGQSVEAMEGLQPRRRAGSRGTPITPEFADLLVQAALRIDSRGRQRTNAAVDRDAALVSLGLAAGLRRGTLAAITHYEIPPESEEDFTDFAVPDFITKGDAGGETLAFTYRLAQVHNYLAGHRTELASLGRSYRPKDPLRLVRADRRGWTALAGDREVSGDWTETDKELRYRMIDIDGSSPLMWLDTRTGEPIGYDMCGRITASARDWARVHLEPKFPQRFRAHDLRHTYATHLTICIFKGAVAAWVHPDMAEAYTAAKLRDALEIAQLSLGHSSEESTKLYLRHAHRFLNIPFDEFLGRR
ncbi:hypothetical protein ACFU8W_38625 [Streptomyces sp. NPDC057565]|uniref:hypothetical protein n=1 Tax=Streptomyces sp. NPDC057565 TaxID=3346169 RepID=UPI0036847752